MIRMKHMYVTRMCHECSARAMNMPAYAHECKCNHMFALLLRQMRTEYLTQN